MISDVSYRNRKTLKRTKIKSKIKYQKMLPLESIPIPNFAHFGILSQINFWTKSRHLEQCAVTTYPLEQFQSLPESKGPKADEDWSFCKLTYHEQIKSRPRQQKKEGIVQPSTFWQRRKEQNTTIAQWVEKCENFFHFLIQSKTKDTKIGQIYT